MPNITEATGNMSRKEFLQTTSSAALFGWLFGGNKKNLTQRLLNAAGDLGQSQLEQEERRRWGLREDGITSIQSIIFLGRRRWNPPGSAVLAEDIDLTNPSVDTNIENGTYAPEELEFLISHLQNQGVNDIGLSTWIPTGGTESETAAGETFLSNRAYRDAVTKIEEKNMSFMPFIEKWHDGPEGTLPVDAFLNPARNGQVIEFLTSYALAYGNSPAWKKYYDQNGELRLPFKIIETISLSDDRSRLAYLSNLSYISEEISRRISPQGGPIVKIGFWIDNSRLPIDGDERFQPVVAPGEANDGLDFSSIDSSSLLGSSIFNPNSVPDYLENINEARDEQGLLTDHALIAMDGLLRAQLDQMIDNELPFQLPIMLGYDSRHIPYFEDQNQFGFGLTPAYFDMFVVPLIRDYAYYSTGFTLGLSNNTSEWNTTLPIVRDGEIDTTLDQMAREAIELYTQYKSIAPGE